MEAGFGVITQETPGCSLGLACITHGLGPGQGRKQGDTPHVAALGSWRAWVTGHVIPPSPWPDLCLKLLPRREKAFKKKTPTRFIEGLGKTLFQKP